MMRASLSRALRGVRAAPSLAARGFRSTAAAWKPEAQLTGDTLNENVVSAEYAVRGPILDRAEELNKLLKEADHGLPFSKTVQCNIGNPQALGQKPVTFTRQVLSTVLNPELLEAAVYPPDVLARAQTYLDAVGSVGAYSGSQGVAVVREEVAQFIAERDGFACDPENIFLTDGASSGVKSIMTLMTRNSNDTVMIPIPQYPLYSALGAMLDGSLVGYYLDEDDGWGVTIEKLQANIDEARAAGKELRGLVVINPGNPTGQNMPKGLAEGIVKLCAAERLVLLADEVYQENVFDPARPFNSFKKIYSELDAAGALADYSPLQMVSFHSTSKGFTGECGLRGGYFELTNFAPEVKAQVTKMAAVGLCSGVVGQIATGLMCQPPKPGSPSHELYKTEKLAILNSLHRRANKVVEALNQLEGVTCNAPEGALYAFPQLRFPDKAVAAAAALGQQADFFYCMQLLEATGVIMVPGSGFGQVEGTYHLRTTFLPAEEDIDGFLVDVRSFHESFMAEHA